VTRCPLAIGRNSWPRSLSERSDQREEIRRRVNGKAIGEDEQVIVSRENGRVRERAR
jgi:hypothetical protein